MTSFPLNNVSLTDQQHSVPHGDRHLDRHRNFPFLDVFPRLPQLSPLANYLVLAVLLVGWDQGTLHCSPPSPSLTENPFSLRSTYAIGGFDWTGIFSHYLESILMDERFLPVKING